MAYNLHIYSISFELAVVLPYSIYTLSSTSLQKPTITKVVIGGNCIIICYKSKIVRLKPAFHGLTVLSCATSGPKPISSRLGVIHNLSKSDINDVT